MLRLIVLVAICASACSPAGPQQLQILSKGGPLVSVAINGAQVASVPCNGGLVFRPGEEGVPPLPWDVKVVDQSTGRVLLEQRITELPRWLVIFGDSAGVSASPVLGPLVSCNIPLSPINFRMPAELRSRLRRFAKRAISAKPKRCV